MKLTSNNFTLFLAAVDTCSSVWEHSNLVDSSYMTTVTTKYAHKHVCVLESENNYYL